jgi:PIN domain nuclease of toxin-antitoxin system
LGCCRKCLAQAGSPANDRVGRSDLRVGGVDLEVAIKASLGRIEADASELAAAIAPSGFVELPVTAAHAAGVAALPSRHGDPFDRLLVAQAMAEPLRLVTADTALAKYSDLVILV